MIVSEGWDFVNRKTKEFLYTTICHMASVRNNRCFFVLAAPASGAGGFGDERKAGNLENGGGF